MINGDFNIIVQIAAVIALLITASILTSSCLTLINNIQNILIRHDGDGNVISVEPGFVTLRSRMLRFPIKASRFYYISFSGILIGIVAIAVRQILTLVDNYWADLAVSILDLFVTNSVTLIAVLVFLAAYALFLGHSIFVYTKIYSRLTILRLNV